MFTFSHLKVFLSIVILSITAGCSTIPEGAESSIESAASTHQNKEEEKSEAQLIKELQQKIDVLENRISMMNDKINETRTTADNALGVKKPTSESVLAHPAKIRGEKIPSGTGFMNDETIQKFRDAMILFEAEKYSEAILQFTNFLREYADHSLAGVAQFHIGECYYKQKEYKLAAEEYRRVLVSYDRSSYVSDSLLRLAEVEERLNQKDSAEKNRQLLSSLFPHSPAAVAVATTSHVGPQPQQADLQSESEQPAAEVPPPTAPTAPSMNPEAEHE